jgi:S-DNA-T family DNA segregation ATPase FtsK/SpoIIIE
VKNNCSLVAGKYEPAIEVILREGRGSVSLLQRALGIGYGRAARLIDFMAEDGIVGSYNGSNAREVLYTLEQREQMKSGAARGGEAQCHPCRFV